MHRSRLMRLGLCAVTLAALIAGFSYATANAAVIDVNNYRFDPLAAEPALPADLLSVPTDASALYLVQFNGPVEEVWKTGLEQLGARIVSYVPEYAFVVRMDRVAGEATRALPHVRWVGLYHPAYRISPEIGHMSFRSEARASDPLRTLLVLVDGDLFTTVVAAQSLGTVLELIDDPTQPEFVIHADPSRINQLASLPEVLWVEELAETFVTNSTTKWVIQSNASPLVPIWDQGLFGEGQIVCQMDSGLDYNSCWFRDGAGDPPSPTHRKVIDYKLWGGVAYDGCSAGHGTHVAGTIVGDQSTINPGVIDYNGMAYKAKIAFQDVGQDTPSACSSGSVAVPASLTAAFDDAYSLGARVHTNSWSSSAHTYDARSQNVDSFMWAHPDFLIFFSAGNAGPSAGTVGSPGTAKNLVTVGASNQAPNQAVVASYSSRGPTSDGRFKPTLTAPGGPTYIISANNNPSSPPLATCATQGSPFTGTSMAAPACAGSALLIRDYFAQGFYPLGTVGGTPVLPSAALVKAMLVNCAQEMGTADQPNSNEGWGRILLDDAMYFQSDARELHVEDDNVGLATGEDVTFQYEVDSLLQPLEITLVWTDYPGTPGASPELVNDLNLTVVSPAADTYLGNVYSSGQSTTGGAADFRNVEECVRRNNPQIGVWTITIHAQNVPQGGHQPFALVTTGSFGDWPVNPAAVADGSTGSRVRLEPARPNPSSGTSTFVVDLPAAARTTLAIYDTGGRRIATLADGDLAAGNHRYEWDGRSDSGVPAASGTYLYRLEANSVAITRKLTLLRNNQD